MDSILVEKHSVQIAWITSAIWNRHLLGIHFAGYILVNSMQNLLKELNFQFNFIAIWDIICSMEED